MKFTHRKQLNKNKNSKDIIKRLPPPKRPKIDPIYQEIIHQPIWDWDVTPTQSHKPSYIGWDGKYLTEREEYLIMISDDDDSDDNTSTTDWYSICYTCQRLSHQVWEFGSKKGRKLRRRFNCCGNSTCIKVKVV